MAGFQRAGAFLECRQRVDELFGGDAVVGLQANLPVTFVPMQASTGM
jgi:hypothetical protein